MSLLLLLRSPFVDGTSAAADPTRHVFVSLTTTPLAEPIWVNVTEFVKDVTIFRGRQRELDQFQAGRATIILDNRDRRFDPEHSAGPHFGNILPMKRVSVQATWNGSTWPIFDGFADEWDQEYDKPDNAICVLRATDGFKVLHGVDLSESVWESEIERESNVVGWYRFGETSGETTLIDSSPNARHGSWDGGVQGFPAGSLLTREPDSAAVFSGTERATVLNQGATGTVWTIEMWIQTPPQVGDTSAVITMDCLRQGSGDHTAAAPNVGLQVTRSNHTSPNRFACRINGQSLVGTSTVANNIRHHVALVRDGSTIRIYVDGIQENSATLSTTTAQAADGIRFSEPFAVASNGPYIGTLDEVVLWSRALTPTEISEHQALGATPWRLDTPGARAGKLLDLVSWPASMRAVETGASELQSASLGNTTLFHLQKVDKTERGRFFMGKQGWVTLLGRNDIVKSPFTVSQTTFGDSGSEIRYTEIELDFNDEQIRNEARISRENGVVQVVTSSTSITKYLRKSHTEEGLLHTEDTFSRSLGELIIDVYQEPFIQITSLTIQPRRSPSTMFAVALGREIGDRVTVRRRPQDVGSAIEKAAVIEGIEHRISPKSWTTKFHLSVAEASQTFWALGISGQSELGQTTTLYL